LRKDIKEYTRRFRLADFFHKEDSDDDPEENDLLRNKSEFIPQNGRNNTLDAVCETLETLPLYSASTKQIKSNLTVTEEKALNSFVKDENIIKEADKGDVVIMNKDFHETKIMNMLSSSEY
jgi:SET domain-containing protein